MRLFGETVNLEQTQRTVLIIDAVDIRAEGPSSLDMQSACYSSYKGATTMKGLVGLSPISALAFLSQMYTGGISDKDLTKCLMSLTV